VQVQGYAESKRRRWGGTQQEEGAGARYAVQNKEQNEGTL